MTKLTDLIGIYDNLDEEPAALNHAGNILAVTISFMVMTWLCVLFRLYTRYFIARTPGVDDVFIILSLLSTSVGSITICLMAVYGGMGRHFILIDDDTRAAYLRIFYVANASYPLSAGFIKLALLFQYLRVYQHGTMLHKATIFVIVIVALWSTVFAIMAWVPTIPIRGYWDFALPAVRYGFGTFDVDAFVAIYMGLTASNMALDIVILGLAAPLLLGKNKFDPQLRWTLLCLFGVGSLASIFSILRLAALMRTAACTYPTFDPTWYGATPIVFAALEVDIATITASLPVFWPVLRELQMSQKIMVTREVKVTREHRPAPQHRRHRLSSTTTTGGSSSRTAGVDGDDLDDDAIELQRSKSGLQTPSSIGTTGGSGYYDDPYIAQQVNPFTKAEFGVTAGVEPGAKGRRSSFLGS